MHEFGRDPYTTARSAWPRRESRASPSADFEGLGRYNGLIYDITTYLGQSAHYARANGKEIILILYDSIPKGWPYY